VAPQLATPEEEGSCRTTTPDGHPDPHAAKPQTAEPTTIGFGRPECPETSHPRQEATRTRIQAMSPRCPITPAAAGPTGIRTPC